MVANPNERAARRASHYFRGTASEMHDRSLDSTGYHLRKSVRHCRNTCIQKITSKMVQSISSRGSASACRRKITAFNQVWRHQALITFTSLPPDNYNDHGTLSSHLVTCWTTASTKHDQIEVWLKIEGGRNLTRQVIQRCINCELFWASLRSSGATARRCKGLYCRTSLHGINGSSSDLTSERFLQGHFLAQTISW